MDDLHLYNVSYNAHGSEFQVGYTEITHKGLVLFVTVNNGKGIAGVASE